jgi:hypothetical protein
MTQDAKPPSPHLEFDRKTPISRLRYKDVEVPTWRIVVVVVVVLAMLALIGFALRRLEAKHASRRNAGGSITVVIQPPAVLLSAAR